ncbi:MAG: multidrug effflux MFS transporter [Bacteroidota bacterium]|nr:multidrug effflux MFS transporter [Bacteroidota bacterium]
MKNKSNSKLFLVIITGILVGFPALITDTYLPSFPSLANFFNTSASNIQMSLMTTMVGIALGQLIIGPLSDRYGRIAPLLISMIFFVISTSLLINTESISSFIILRFAQGLTCSSGMVLSRAILTDSFTSQELAKALSFNTAILGFTPALAPVIGGIILTFTYWQGIFVFLLIFGCIIFFLCTRIKESHPKKKRILSSSQELSKSLLAVIKNKEYWFYVLIFSFSMGVMFAYISSSPFIFQQYYELSPLVYSILFGTNALALALGALFSGFIKDQVNALRIGISGLAVMSIFTVTILLSGLTFIYFEASIFIMFIFDGMTYPSSTTLALEVNRKNAGTASSIHGATSFLFGGIISPLVGLGNILYSTSIGIIACAFATLFLSMGLVKYLNKTKLSLTLSDDEVTINV